MFKIICWVFSLLRESHKIQSFQTSLVCKYTNFPLNSFRQCKFRFASKLYNDCYKAVVLNQVLDSMQSNNAEFQYFTKSRRKDAFI